VFTVLAIAVKGETYATICLGLVLYVQSNIGRSLLFNSNFEGVVGTLFPPLE